MPKYEVCFVNQEYRWVDIDALTSEDARDTATDMIASGYIQKTKPDDDGIDIFVTLKKEEK